MAAGGVRERGQRAGGHLRGVAGSACGLAHPSSAGWLSAPLDAEPGRPRIEFDLPSCPRAHEAGGGSP